MSIAHLLNVDAEVWRLVSVSDGQGGWTETPAYDHDERVRISPAGSSEVLVAAQQSLTLTHDAYGLPSADLRRGDQLRVDGRTYQVLGGRPPSRLHHTKWWLEETQVAVAEAG